MKKRVIISMMTIVLILGGLFYYDNSQKKILFEDITSDDIESFSLYYCGCSSDGINDRKQIDGFLEYIHSMKIKPTNENVPYETPDCMISFKDKDGNLIAIDIYGDIAYLYPRDRYPGKYSLYGCDYSTLEKVRKELGIENK